MTRISRSHPRYRSLLVRDGLAKAHRTGLVVPEGLIAQGRGEAFDYLLGERTTPSARRAERMAALWLARADRPVVSVNGNVAALAADRIARLQRALPRIGVEVNLFHRSPGRAGKVASALRAAGVLEVLGVHPRSRIPGLPSDRARVDGRGIGRADVCLVPLEDGDRTDALRALGKRVISIDLNPMSRTSRSADLPIIDELTRALDGIILGLRRPAATRKGPIPAFDRAEALRAAVVEMRAALRRQAKVPWPGPERASRRRVRGSARRSRRTP
jgi:4-phosphopantoate--beta-alanine ligase